MHTGNGTLNCGNLAKAGLVPVPSSTYGNHFQHQLETSLHAPVGAGNDAEAEC